MAIFFSLVLPVFAGGVAIGVSVTLVMARHVIRKHRKEQA